MRIKALVNYNFSSLKRAILIFYLFYLAGALFSGILSTAVSSVVVGVENDADVGTTLSLSSSVISFAIFMFVTSLIISQKDTRFFITRSASRKEIFLSCAATLVPLAAIMSALQIASVYIDGFARYLMGTEFNGLAMDMQSMQAPDATNILTFFAIGFSIALCFGALSYLLGSLLARWKVPTLGVLIFLAVTFVALLALSDFFEKVVDILKFMFIDDNSGFIVALKQIALAAAAMAVAFPVMRKITAAKQS